MTEYEALIHGLRITSKLGTHHQFISKDSELVISRFMKEASCHDIKMVDYCDEIWKHKKDLVGSSSITTLDEIT
jgi:ribonuclease HI